MEDSQALVRDIGSEWKLSKVFPDLSNRWQKVRYDLFNLTGRQIRVTDGLRSFTEQWKVWGEGRTKDSSGNWSITDLTKVRTHAQPGMSWHQYGLAIDSCFMGGDPYLKFLPLGESQGLWFKYGIVCKENGLTWGGDWPEPKTDAPHCQMTYGLDIHAVQILFEDQGIKGVWNKCTQILSCGGELA